MGAAGGHAGPIGPQPRGRLGEIAEAYVRDTATTQVIVKPAACDSEDVIRLLSGTPVGAPIAQVHDRPGRHKLKQAPPLACLSAATAPRLVNEAGHPAAGARVDGVGVNLEPVQAFPLEDGGDQLNETARQKQDSPTILLGLRDEVGEPVTHPDVLAKPLDNLIEPGLHPLVLAPNDVVDPPRPAVETGLDFSERANVAEFHGNDVEVVLGGDGPVVVNDDRASWHRARTIAAPSSPAREAQHGASPTEVLSCCLSPVLEFPGAMTDLPEPTVDDIEALVGPATPHFAYQIRARVRELIQDLPEDHPTRRYGETRLSMLDRLGHATSKADEGPIEPSTRIGWDQIPSHGAVRAAETHEAEPVSRER